MTTTTASAGASPYLPTQYDAPSPADTDATTGDYVTPQLVHLADGWTPQGQAYDGGSHELLTTYYADTNGNGKDDTVRLTVQDLRSGGTNQDVVLLGKGDIDGPTHGGGVAIRGDFVYVADTDAVYVYRRSDIQDASATRVLDPETGMRLREPSVAAVDVIDMPKMAPELVGQVATYDGGSCQDLRQPASYMTIEGDHAYVGSWSKDGDGLSGSLVRFDIDPDTGALVNPSDPIKAPDQAQGVTVVNGGEGLLFSTNHETNKLVYQPITNTPDAFSASPEDREVLDEGIGNGGLIGSYVEEINIVGDELWVTYESGADKFRDDVDDPRDSIQRIRLDDLDLSGTGLTVDQLTS